MAKRQSLAHPRVLLGKSYRSLPVIGLVVVLLSVCAFGAIAEDVLRRDSLAIYDSLLGKWLLNQTTPAGGDIFYTITLLGSATVVEIGVAALGLWLASRKRWLYLSTLVASVGGGTLLNGMLKSFFSRPRPDYMAAYLQETSFSFPSGHAMTAVIAYGVAAYLLASSIENRKRRAALYIATALLAFLIGFSRLYLGVHYLTDVLGGWAIGIAWLSLCILTTEALKLSA